MPTQPRKNVPVLVTAGFALAAAAGFGARAAWPGSTPPAATARVPVATARVIHTDVAARQEVAGTLGYQGLFTVASELDGILTALPAPGSTVRRGRPLFAVSGQPVRLLYGSLPAWRPFAPGMTAGPDVRQLQRNLTALGFDAGPADGVFGWSTELAVRQWQQATGLLPVTGTIQLGEVAFLPGPLRVTTTSAQLGAPVAAGTTVVSGTSLTPGVKVWLAPGGTAVRPGDHVLVTMPDGTTVAPGTVTAVGSVATAPDTASGATPNGGAGSGSSGGQSAAVPITITIGAAVPAGLDQAPVQVAITAQHADNVLAIPVTALLATPGGGYAVRLSGSGSQLIPVTTGLFDAATGLVEVTGSGLAPGLAVEVAQG
jgi:peptidoglycan hydrolase-like protein with peptidoglycan-binding domain